MNYFSSSYIQTNIAKLATQYVGRYLDGIEPEKFGVAWKSGELKLRDVRIRKDIIESLNLPFCVQHGSIGIVTITFPFSNLLALTISSTHQPLIIELTDVFILLSPKLESEWDIDTLKEQFQSNRERLLDLCDVSLLAEQAKKQLTTSKSDGKKGWMSKFASKILTDIRIHIRNIHLRVEDKDAQFGIGITLEELQIHTPNDTEWTHFIQSIKNADVKAREREALANNLVVKVLAQQKKILKIYNVSAYHTKSSLMLNNSEMIADDKNFQRYMRSIFSKSVQINYVLKPFTGIIGLEIQTTQLVANRDRGVYRHSRRLGTLIQAYHTQFHNVEDQCEYYQPYRPDIPIKANAIIWWNYSVGCIIRRLNKNSQIKKKSRWSWGEHLQAARVNVWKQDFQVLLIKRLLSSSETHIEMEWTLKMQKEYLRLLGSLPKKELLEIYINTKQAYLDDQYDRLHNINYEPDKSKWEQLLKTNIPEYAANNVQVQKKAGKQPEDDVIFYDIEESQNEKLPPVITADVFQDVEDLDSISPHSKNKQNSADKYTSNAIVDKLLAAEIYNVYILIDLELLQISFKISDEIQVLNSIKKLHIAASQDEALFLNVMLQDWSMVYDDFGCNISYRFLTRFTSLDKTYFHLEMCSKDPVLKVPKLYVEVQQITFTYLPIVISNCLDLINSLKFPSLNDENNESAFITQSLVKFEKMSQVEQIKLYKNIILDVMVAAPTIILIASSSCNIMDLLNNQTPRIVIHLGLFTMTTLDYIIPPQETCLSQPHKVFIYTNNKRFSVLLKEVHIEYKTLNQSITLLDHFGVSVEISILWYYIKEMLKVFVKPTNYDSRTAADTINSEAFYKFSIEGNVSPLSIYINQDAFHSCVYALDSFFNTSNLHSDQMGNFLSYDALCDELSQDNKNDLLFPLKVLNSRKSVDVSDATSVNPFYQKPKVSLMASKTILEPELSVNVADSDPSSVPVEFATVNFNLPEFSLVIDTELSNVKYPIVIIANSSFLNIVCHNKENVMEFSLGDLNMSRMDVLDNNDPLRYLISTQEVKQHDLHRFPFTKATLCYKRESSQATSQNSHFISIKYTRKSMDDIAPILDIIVTRFLHISFQPLILSSLFLFWKSWPCKPKSPKAPAETSAKAPTSIITNVILCDTNRENDSIKNIINVSVVGVSITCLESKANNIFGIVKFDSMEFKMETRTFGTDVNATLSNFKFIDCSSPDGIYRQLFGSLDNQKYLLSITCLITRECAPYFEGAPMQLVVNLQSLEIICYLTKLLRIFKWILNDFLNTLLSPNVYLNQFERSQSYFEINTPQISSQMSSMTRKEEVPCVTPRNLISNHENNWTSDYTVSSSGQKKLLAWLFGIINCTCNLDSGLLNSIAALQNTSSANENFIPPISLNKISVSIHKPIIIIPVSIYNTKHITLSVRDICINNKFLLHYKYGIIEEYTIALKNVTIVEKVDNNILLNDVDITVQYKSTNEPKHQSFPLWMTFQFSDVPWYLTPSRVNLLWQIIYTNVLGYNSDTILPQSEHQPNKDSPDTSYSKRPTKCYDTSYLQNETDVFEDSLSFLFEFKMPGLFVFLNQDSPAQPTICFHADMLHFEITKFLKSNQLKFLVTVKAACLYHCSITYLNVVLSDSKKSLHDVANHELQRLIALFENKQSIPDDVAKFINQIQLKETDILMDFEESKTPTNLLSKEFVLIYKQHSKGSSLDLEIKNPRVVVERAFVETVLKYVGKFNFNMSATNALEKKNSKQFVKQATLINNNSNNKADNSCATLYSIKLKNASLIAPDQGDLSNKTLLVLRGTFQNTKSINVQSQHNTTSIYSVEIFRTDLQTLSSLEDYENRFKTNKEFLEDQEECNLYCLFDFESFVESYIINEPASKCTTVKEFISNFTDALPKRLFSCSSNDIPLVLSSIPFLKRAESKSYRTQESRAAPPTIYELLQDSSSSWSDCIRLLCPNVECIVDITETYSNNANSVNYINSFFKQPSIIFDNIPVEIKNALNIEKHFATQTGSIRSKKNRHARNANLNGIATPVLLEVSQNPFRSYKVQNNTISIHPISAEISYQDLIFIYRLVETFSGIFPVSKNQTEHKSSCLKKEDAFSKNTPRNSAQEHTSEQLEPKSEDSDYLQRFVSCDFSEIKLLFLNDSNEHLNAPFLQFSMETGTLVLCQWTNKFFITTFTTTYALSVFNQKAVTFEPIVEPFRASMKYIKLYLQNRNSVYWNLSGSHKTILYLNVSTNLISTCLENYNNLYNNFKNLCNLNNDQLNTLSQNGVFRFTPYRLKNLTGVDLYVYQSNTNEPKPLPKITLPELRVASTKHKTHFRKNIDKLPPGEHFYRLTKCWIPDLKYKTPKLYIDFTEEYNSTTYSCSARISLQFAKKCLIPVNQDIYSGNEIETSLYLIGRTEVVGSQKQILIESQTMVHNELGPNISIMLALSKYLSPEMVEVISPNSTTGINITVCQSTCLYVKPKCSAEFEELGWSNSIDLSTIWRRINLLENHSKESSSKHQQNLTRTESKYFFPSMVPKFLPSMVLKCSGNVGTTNLENVFYIVADFQWEHIQYRNDECYQLNIYLRPTFKIQNYLPFKTSFRLDVHAVSEELKLQMKIPDKESDILLRTTVEDLGFDEVTRIYSLPLTDSGFMSICSINGIWGKRKKLYTWSSEQLALQADDRLWLKEWCSLGIKLFYSKRFKSNKIIVLKTTGYDNLQFNVNLIIRSVPYQAIDCVLHCPIWLHTYINLSGMIFQYEPEVTAASNFLNVPNNENKNFYVNPNSTASNNSQAPSYVILSTEPFMQQLKRDSNLKYQSPICVDYKITEQLSSRDPPRSPQLQQPQKSPPPFSSSQPLSLSQSPRPCAPPSAAKLASLHSFDSAVRRASLCSDSTDTVSGSSSLSLVDSYIPIYEFLKQFRLIINNQAFSWVAMNDQNKVFVIKVFDKFYELISVLRDSPLDIPFNIKTLVLAPRYILINNTGTPLYYYQAETETHVEITEIMPLYWVNLTSNFYFILTYSKDPIKQNPKFQTNRSTGKINIESIENHFSYALYKPHISKTNSCQASASYTATLERQELLEKERVIVSNLPTYNNNNYHVLRLQKHVNPYSKSTLVYLTNENADHDHLDMDSVHIVNETKLSFLVSQLSAKNGIKLYLGQFCSENFGWFSNILPLVLRIQCLNYNTFLNVSLESLENSNHARFDENYKIQLKRANNCKYIHINNLLNDIFSPTKRDLNNNVNSKSVMVDQPPTYTIENEAAPDSYKTAISLDMFNASKQIVKDIITSLIITIPSICVSVISELPQEEGTLFQKQELLAIHLTDLKLRFLQTPVSHLFVLTIQNLQIDNPEPFPNYPVMFQKLGISASTYQKEYETRQLLENVDLPINPSTHPFVDILIVKNVHENAAINNSNHLVFARLIVLPFVCKLDLTFVTTSLYVLRKFMRETNNRNKPKPPPTQIYAVPFKSVTGALLDTNQNPNSLVPLQPTPQVILYIEKLIIHPILVHFSFSSRSNDYSNAQNQTLLLKFLYTIGSVQLAALYFKTYLLKNQSVDVSNLIANMKKEYAAQLLQQAYAFTNVDFLGNPLTTLSHIGTGLVDLVTEPVRSLNENSEALSVVKGLGKGAKSLWNNAVFGTFNAVSKVSGVAAQGLSVLSLDEDYSRENLYASRRKPKDASEGIVMGTEAFSRSLIGGLKGLVFEPTKGVEENGFEGLLQGVGKGVVGALVKPVAGMLEMTALATGGIQQAAGESSGLVREVYKRCRYPRCFYTADQVIRPYNPQDAQLIDTLIDLQFFNIHENLIEAIFHDVNLAVLITTDNLFAIRYKPEPASIYFSCALWKISAVKISQSSGSSMKQESSTAEFEKQPNIKNSSVIIHYYVSSPTYQLKKLIQTSSKEAAVKLATLIEEKRLA